MSDLADLRPNEEAVELEPASDATLRFIGTIRTPWRDRKDCAQPGLPGRHATDRHKARPVRLQPEGAG